jgi:ABC-type amino acid transport system permease subunit
MRLVMPQAFRNMVPLLLTQASSCSRIRRWST